jgi:serine/threonine-protein kinase
VQAKADLSAAHLNYSITQEFNDQVDKDVVISQDRSGMKVKEGSSIQLRVSRGVEKQTMQDFKGKPMKDVLDQLTNAGFKPEQIKENDVFSTDAPKDTVFQQDPKAGESYDPTKVVFTFTVSKGPEQIPMPDLIGSTEQSAKAKLQSVGLTIKQENILTQPSFAQPKGRVFKQWPYDKDAGVDPGADDIHILISSGPPEDAVQYTGTYPLQPAKEGQQTTWKIVVTDAQYENFEYKTITSSKTENVPVTVTLTKDKNATIQIFRDNALFDSKTVTYSDYLNQKNKPSATPSPSGPAGASPSASVKPSASPSPTTTAGGR